MKYTREQIQDTVESLNELLIREGHAVEYHGGKR